MIEALEGISDQELFDQANADEAPADEPVAEVPPAEPEQQEQPTEQTQARDEQGRFTAETTPAPAATTPVATQDEQQPRGERIPLAEYLSEREKRQNFENELKAERERIAQERQEFQRRLQALEKPAAQTEKVAKPDPLLDPEAYEAYLEKKVEDRILNDRREESLQRAHKVYKEEFTEAYAAAQKQIDPGLIARMQASRDPGETLIEWHREQKTRAEIGNDLNAFRQREQERLLSDPAFLAKAIEKARGVAQAQPQQPGTPPAVSLPPSLTRATNASAVTSADDNDVSDEGLWRHANA